LTGLTGFVLETVVPWVAFGDVMSAVCSILAQRDGGRGVFLGNLVLWGLVVFRGLLFVLLLLRIKNIWFLLFKLPILDRI